MLLQIPKLLHFSREEKSLLNRVDLISNSPLLKFFDRRVKRERGSIQYQRGAPSKDLGAPVCCSTKISSLSGTFLLLGFSNLRSFWRLLLHYGLNLALFRALLPSPLISFSFLLYGLKGEVWVGRGVGGLGSISTAGESSPTWVFSKARRLGVLFWITIPSGMFETSWLALI